MFNITWNLNPGTNESSFDFDGEPIEGFQEALTTFTSLYEIDNIIFHPERKPALREKSQRKCRFCGKSVPQVTFKNVAHLMPEFMGNNNIISDFECDSCNTLFGRYGSDLANFIGLSRTLSFSKGKEGIPKYKSPDKNLIIEKDKEPVFKQ